MDGQDISNYTSPFTDGQLTFVGNNLQFTIIGVQDADKARAFQQQLLTIPNHELQYYLDRPRRDWTVFPWYSQTKVWIDIEKDCYTKVADIDMDILLLQNIGCRPGIYCNKESLKILDGPPNSEWANLPLWYANYPADGHKPTLAEFVPFNGWNAPEIWQYSSKGVQGINCDLNVSFEPTPPVLEDYVTHFTQYFASGKVWEIDCVAPPGR